MRNVISSCSSPAELSPTSTQSRSVRTFWGDVQNFLSAERAKRP
jgi:hypothetical protein